MQTFQILDHQLEISPRFDIGYVNSCFSERDTVLHVFVVEPRAIALVSSSARNMCSRHLASSEMTQFQLCPFFFHVDDFNRVTVAPQTSAR